MGDRLPAIAFRPHRCGWSSSLACVVAIAGGCAGAVESAEDGSYRTETDRGLYSVEIEPAKSPAPIGRIHAWRITVTTTGGGRPVYPARIVVGGGMQGHSHGLPTQPIVTDYEGDGRYVVDGVKFNMAGAWTLSFVIESNLGTDRADFEIDVDF